MSFVARDIYIKIGKKDIEKRSGCGKGEKIRANRTIDER